ncbi:MAG TPA: hypothetical protein VNM48_22500 [Chloroflexota bacterium]|nr:hypothetical protein [Chloroflexota bacterium]
MPFAKGRTANRRTPKHGPPRSYETFAALFEAALALAPDAPAPTEGETTKQRIVRAIVERAKKADLQAFDRIADRTEGKVPETINQNVRGAITDAAAQAVITRHVERGGSVAGET